MSASLVALLLASQSTLGAPAAKNDIPYPHPVIVEVLFNVPNVAAADADKDGKRDAQGDEFVELINPHNKPINLKGYTITDRFPKGGKQLSFTFPDCELAPGEIVVVFNGYQSKPAGAVGDSKSAPPSVNDQFHNAKVFTMKIDKRNKGFANNGDFVILRAPDGSPIDAVVWGFPSHIPPGDTLRIQQVGNNVKGSVQRTHPKGDLEPHTTLPGGDMFSPGRIPN